MNFRITTCLSLQVFWGLLSSGYCFVPLASVTQASLSSPSSSLRDVRRHHHPHRRYPRPQPRFAMSVDLRPGSSLAVEQRFEQSAQSGTAIFVLIFATSIGSLRCLFSPIPLLVTATTKMPPTTASDSPPTTAAGQRPGWGLPCPSCGSCGLPEPTLEDITFYRCARDLAANRVNNRVDNRVNMIRRTAGSPQGQVSEQQTTQTEGEVDEQKETGRWVAFMMLSKRLCLGTSPSGELPPLAVVCLPSGQRLDSRTVDGYCPPRLEVAHRDQLPVSRRKVHLSRVMNLNAALGYGEALLKHVLPVGEWARIKDICALQEEGSAFKEMSVLIELPNNKHAAAAERDWPGWFFSTDKEMLLELTCRNRLAIRHVDEVYGDRYFAGDHGWRFRYSESLVVVKVREHANIM